MVKNPFIVTMNEDDPADLDGDGRFDGIDIPILEDGKGKSGCCLIIFIFSMPLAAGVAAVYYLANIT